MKLFGSTRSPYVRKVRLMIHEAGLADDVTLIKVAVSPYDIELRLQPHNPLMRVPTLVPDDGDAVIGSREICEYVDSVAARSVSFPPGEDRRTINRAHALGDGLADLAIAWVRERWRSDGEAPADFIAAARAKLRGTADLLERDIVALAGGFHIGAAALGSALGYFDFRLADEDWRGGRPTLTDWHARFSARPSAQATSFED